ncbi:MAG TPA: SDR family oxidoreductase [Nocardioides sp.]
MTIAVTGTSGHLGRLVVEQLLERGVPAQDIVATARTTSAVADLADRGVVVRRADYADSDSLDAALTGVTKLLLVSSSEIGQRLPQHRNVLDAARRAGVSLVAYTSVLRADTSDLALAAEHKATEEALVESGLPHVLLRNGWYTENYTAQAPVALEHGAVLGAAGEGKVSAATRADYAAAAAAVLVEDDHAGQVYELGGEAFTLAEYAAELSAQAGTSVAYQDLSEEAYAAALGAAGLPQAYAELLASCDTSLKHGALFTDSDDLERLIGRSPTTLTEAIKSALG